jgi:hypothetical protein
VQIGLGVLTFAGSGVIVHWLNDRKEQRDLYRAKLETLFVELGEYQEDTINAVFPFIAVIEGRREYASANQQMGASLSSKPNRYSTLQMLISLYFRELEPQLIKCRKATDDNAAFIFELRMLAEAGQSPSRQLLDPYEATIREFNQAVDALRDQIIKNGKRLRLLKRGSIGPY